MKNRIENEKRRGKENLVCFVVMPEKNENNTLSLFINYKFKNKALKDMDSSFTGKIMFERLVMRVLNNFCDFSSNSFFQNRIFSSCFINLSFTQRFDFFVISHFQSSKISETELNLIEGSFNAFFSSSTCFGLGGNSSTGCQSICSQNSQSSSVISLVCLNLLEMSCFINLTTALANSSESNLISLDLTNSFIIKESHKEYLKLSGRRKND